MLTQHQLRTLYEKYSLFVRTLIAARYSRWRKVSVDDLEQTVWLYVAKGWPTPPPPNPYAWLTRTTKNAVAEIYRRGKMKKRDESKTDYLDAPTVAARVASMHAPSDVPVDFERFRTARRVRAIARKLDPKDFAIFERMMADWESVPAAHRKRVIAGVRELLRIEQTNQEAGYIVEGPSHCGRAVRRLGLDDDGPDSTDDENEGEAA